MKKMRFGFLIGILFALCGNTKAQDMKSGDLLTRYALETTLDGKKPVVFENDDALLKFYSNTGDLYFYVNLANLTTGNKTTDSLLKDKGKIKFEFKGNLGMNYFEVIKNVNDDTFHKVPGTITVDGSDYPAIAEVSMRNISDKSNMGNILMDMRLSVDPKKVIIPYLSDYFKYSLLFQMNDGVVNQNN